MTIRMLAGRILTGWGAALLGACLMTITSTSIAQIASDDDVRATRDLMPSATLTPEQVVQIQLEALRLNDAQNRGIEVAFRFASPDNKLHTGPLPRFISMIHERPYSLMLGYENVAYDPVEIVEDYARQRVTLISSGVIVAYEFYLSRQTKGDCLGCWLTDAVIAKPPTGLQVQS
jgi:Domain of unknown function (DUF4864)